jgi:hypothetical protein
MQKVAVNIGKHAVFCSPNPMTLHSERLRELYCIKWPQKCEIYQAKATTKWLLITLWPTEKLDC